MALNDLDGTYVRCVGSGGGPYEIVGVSPFSGDVIHRVTLTSWSDEAKIFFSVFALRPRAVPVHF